MADDVTSDSPLGDSIEQSEAQFRFTLPEDEAPEVHDEGVEAPDHRPDASSEAPQDEEAQPSSTTESEPLPEFDPDWMLPFKGLLHLGRLTDEFEWLGHRFVIQTMSTDQMIEVGLIHKDYIGTLADAKAYQVAVLAACVVSVDGEPLPIPIDRSKDGTGLRTRYGYISRNWFPPVIDYLYERYLQLEVQVGKVMDSLGKQSG